MVQVTLAPYMLTDADGLDPRIVIPVTTPAAFVLVESRTRGVFTVKRADRSGVQLAIDAARTYVRAHRAHVELLYEEIDRAAHRTRSTKN